MEAVAVGNADDAAVDADERSERGFRILRRNSARDAGQRRPDAGGSGFGIRQAAGRRLMSSARAHKEPKTRAGFSTVQGRAREEIHAASHR